MVINDYPIGFLGEVAVRSVISFLFVLIFIKFIGRRGIKQMTPLELVIFLSLGSAAGDVALYEDTPFLSALVVFVVVIFLYKVFTYLLKKSDYFQEKFDGKPLLVIDEGALKWQLIQKQSFSTDELMMELRQNSVGHLGQVQFAFLEMDGNISVFLYENNEDVKPGLPTLPLYMLRVTDEIGKEGYYSCGHCSYTHFQELSIPASPTVCPQCGARRWVLSATGPKGEDFSAYAGRAEKTASM
ncbi:DUF421 domain-containing protein [Brenneria alni]|nr:YetF domain-containing protein [Brenneria alni]